MQKLLNIIFFPLILAFLASGCDKHEHISEDILRYGKRDTVSLGFSYYSIEQGQTSVKAPVYVNPTAVNNFNIYIFNESGDLITHKYTSGTLTANGTYFIRDLIIYRNMRYRIYAIANVGESLPCKSITQVEDLGYFISDISQVADPYGGVLMSGKTDLQLLTHGQIVRVRLERCVSKFLLRCNYSGLNPGVRITVKRVQLKNAPSRILFFRESLAFGGSVIDGEILTGSYLSGLHGSGASFYLFENMQGIVAASATNNKLKEQQMNSRAKANSSYIEMEYDYSSSEKRGTIIYRFYLGRTHRDCDVKRNTQYTCTVLFTGDGSSGENSWSVDNSGLADLVTAIYLEPASHTFRELGGNLQLSAYVLPATAADKALTWRSSDPLVATVTTSGMVTSVGDGVCEIIATSSDGTNISSSCFITVDSKTPVSGVTVSPQTLSMFPGDAEWLMATVSPNNATVKTVTWSSSNSSVVSVDSEGIVIALREGEADITVSSTDDNTKSAVCKVTVMNKSFSISPSTLNLYVSQGAQLRWEGTPSVSSPVFRSSDTGIAGVDNSGRVTAVSAGSCTITATGNGINSTCRVTVMNKSFSISPSTLNLYVSQGAQLRWEGTPSVSSPVFRSSDTGIAGVDNSGRVTAVSAGSCTITATGNGINSTCRVTVSNPEIAFPYASKIMYDGEEAVIPYSRLLPSDAVPVVGSSSSGTVEILESTTSGIRIRARAVGVSTITATVHNVSARCVITVEKLRIVPSVSSITAYTNFNEDISYTVYPSHASSLSVKLSHGNPSDAAYFIFPTASVPNRIQGRSVNSTPMPVKLSVAGRPDVTATVNCIVKPCLEINDPEFLTGQVDILANAYSSKRRNVTHPDIYIERQVNYISAPRATVIWTCNKRELKVVNGKIYTEDKSPANGSDYFVTASVMGDNGVVTSLTNSKGIRVFEEINVLSYGRGTFLREEDAGHELLPVFDVLFRNFVSSTPAGSPIEKKVIENSSLRFSGQSFSYSFHEEAFGARGDTEYEQTTTLSVTYKGNRIGKYREDPLWKYFTSILP